MGSATASAAPILTQTPSVISDCRLRGWKKLSGPSCIRMYLKFQHIDSGRMKLQMNCSGRRVPITHANRTQSASFICSAAPGGAVETRPIKSPIEAPIGLVKPPQLDDGGTGLPPRDGGGGGGGGGGGASSSGGFFLFGFLLILSYIKDLESEKEN